MIYYHIVSFSIGVILDLIIGDPYKLPHPIRLIGSFISRLDKKYMDEAIKEKIRDDKREYAKGVLTVLIIVISAFLVTLFIVTIAYIISPIIGIIVEAILTSYCLATKSLKTESMKVYKALIQENINGARYAVSMIVGRDTASLDEKGIIRAAVETVAENTSDGVIAPMLYLIIGGPVLGMTYKSINTLDSMIAYHNDRYEYFGRCAAKLDDIVNFVPARISAYLMIVAAFICKSFNGKEAYRIFMRDRYNHKSPNSAQTESVCAGALQVRLAGPSYYFGKLVEKPYIGDDTFEINVNDIKRINKLMYLTMVLLFIMGEILLITILSI